MRERIAADLAQITRYPDRHVGGAGNAAATAYAASRFADAGWQVERTPFPCVEWEWGAASVVAGGESFDLHVGPYSLPVQASGELWAVSEVEELEAGGPAGAVLLLHGGIASGQLMPKHFPFYNPPEHGRIIAALEAARPAAVIAATGVDPYMVGGQYPFPLFEDGDLDIPNAYLTDVEGQRLLAHEGSTVAVRIDSRRYPASAEQLVARREGRGPGRVVVAAHIDSRTGSPGALDDGTGVVALLAVADLLGPGPGDGPTIEIVPFNGEDHYASPGERLWLADNGDRLSDIRLFINIDDAGWNEAIDHVSLYGCDDATRALVAGAMAGHPRLDEGPQWFQGDHAIVSMRGVPAIAIASAGIEDFMRRFAHTERDTLELVDPGLVEQCARFVVDVIDALDAAAG